MISNLSSSRSASSTRLQDQQKTEQLASFLLEKSISEESIGSLQLDHVLVIVDRHLARHGANEKCPSSRSCCEKCIHATNPSFRRKVGACLLLWQSHIVYIVSSKILSPPYYPLYEGERSNSDIHIGAIMSLEATFRTLRDNRLRSKRATKPYRTVSSLSKMT